MITVQSRTHVPGARGQQVTDFLLRCDDREYQRWWPGTHLHFHTLERRPGELGNTVFMDERIGKRRVKGTAVVSDVVPGKRLVWQWKARGLRLPVRLVLELEDDDRGVRVTHTLCAGFSGLGGSLLDPLFRLYLTPGFARAMDEHVQVEFPRLAPLLTSPAG